MSAVLTTGTACHKTYSSSVNLKKDLLIVSTVTLRFIVF